MILIVLVGLCFDICCLVNLVMKDFVIFMFVKLLDVRGIEFLEIWGIFVLIKCKVLGNMILVFFGGELFDGKLIGFLWVFEKCKWWFLFCDCFFNDNGLGMFGIGLLRIFVFKLKWEFNGIFDMILWRFI